MVIIPITIKISIFAESLDASRASGNFSKTTKNTLKNAYFSKL